MYRLQSLIRVPRHFGLIRSNLLTAKFSFIVVKQHCKPAINKLTLTTVGNEHNIMYKVHVRMILWRNNLISTSHKGTHIWRLTYWILHFPRLLPPLVKKSVTVTQFRLHVCLSISSRSFDWAGNFRSARIPQRHLNGAHNAPSETQLRLVMTASVHDDSTRSDIQRDDRSMPNDVERRSLRMSRDRFITTIFPPW